MHYMADTKVECPLLSRQIAEGLCIDIIMALGKYLKKEAVPEVKDWEKAKEICSGCRIYQENY
jgi:hypothetical protein